MAHYVVVEDNYSVEDGTIYDTKQEVVECLIENSQQWEPDWLNVYYIDKNGCAHGPLND